MAGIFRRVINRLPIIWSLLLIGLGLFIYRGFLQDNFIPSLILIIVSTLSMIVVLGVWRKFVSNYADEIIHWTSEKAFFRKFVAGGSFSYYEYKEDLDKLGTFEPISRFLSLLIAFIGIATSLANIVNLEPTSPTSDINSTLVWSGLIFIVPILLTPIIPIIWAMEDLQLKAWNSKFKTNVRISNRYKARFNSFIAIGTLGAAFGLSRNPQLEYVDQITNFLNLLFSGILILTYPIAVLTTLYYLYFRGKMVSRIKAKLDLPVAETILIYRDEFGNILSEEGEVIEYINGEKMHATSSSEKIEINPQEEESEEEKNFPQKISSGAKNVVTRTGEVISDTGKSVVNGFSAFGRIISKNTIGRFSGSEEEDRSKNNKTESASIKDQKKSKKRGGSATEGLWDKDY